MVQLPIVTIFSLQEIDDCITAGYFHVCYSAVYQSRGFYCSLRVLPTAHSMWLVASTDAKLDRYMYMTWLANERRCDDIITCMPFVTQ